MRQRIQKLVKLFFGEAFGSVRLGAFAFSQCCDLSRRLDDMWVRKMISSVLALFLILCLEKIPEQRDVARNGILLSLSAFESSIRPPMITVWPSGVTTTVSAERWFISGALTVPPVPTESGPTAIDRRPVRRFPGTKSFRQSFRGDKRSNPQDDAHALVGH